MNKLFDNSVKIYFLLLPESAFLNESLELHKDQYILTAQFRHLLA